MQNVLLYAGKLFDAVVVVHETDDAVRQYLEEALGHEEAERAASGGIVAGEKIDWESLEGIENNTTPDIFEVAEYSHRGSQTVDTSWSRNS